MSTGRVGTMSGTTRGATRLRGARMGARDRATARGGEGSLIGLDVGPTSRRSRPLPKHLAPLLGIAIIAALGLAALRMDVLRTGYALTEAHREELGLRDELHTLSVALQELRDPAMLRQRAAELGFTRPSHLVDVEEPLAPGRLAARGPDEAAPPVASPPVQLDEVALAETASAPRHVEARP